MPLIYNREGTGKRAILLITGLGGHANFWDAHRPRLAKEYTVLSFDQRGCGRNRGREGVHTLDEIASDALGILDDAGIEKAVIIGHSMGGVVTQCLALDHPARLEAAVFSGTFCAFDWYMELVGDLRQSVLDEAGAEACARLSALMAMPGGNVDDPHYDLRGRVAGPARRMDDEVLLARQRAPYKFDRRAELPSVRMPALIIAAQDDMLAPVYQARAMAQLIPDSRLEVMDGGHFFPNTRVDSYFAAVQSFLRTLQRD